MTTISDCDTSDRTAKLHQQIEQQEVSVVLGQSIVPIVLETNIRSINLQLNDGCVQCVCIEYISLV